jgi:hypothetical protein
MNEEMQTPLSEQEQALLAGYVLGDLTPEEAQQLEQLVRDRPDVLSEISAMQASYELLPQTVERADPPPGLRSRVLAEAPQGDTSAIRQRPWRAVLAVLGAIALLGLIIDNFRLRQQLQLVQGVEIERTAAILRQPNSRLITLEATEGGDAAGTLMFTPGQWQEVIVSLGDLPPLPPEQIYRMWLGLDNGDVIFCGEFNTNSDGTVFVRLTPEANPPQGVKATRLFVTVNDRAEPLIPSQQIILDGTV